MPFQIISMTWRKKSSFSPAMVGTCVRRARLPAKFQEWPFRHRWAESSWTQADRPLHGLAYRPDPHNYAWMVSSPAPVCWASSPCRPWRPGPSSHWWWDWRWCGEVVCAWSPPNMVISIIIIQPPSTPNRYRIFLPGSSQYLNSSPWWSESANYMFAVKTLHIRNEATWK